jgi:ABC-type Mn2+/Zn2+ transport system ATPase subunit
MIKVNAISFARGGSPIYSNFSAELNQGESVLFTGPNGSGKSTLVALIGGLLKPQEGNIEIDGVDIASLNSKGQAALRSIAPQRRSFTLAFTVQEVLNFLPKSARVKDSAAIIEKLNLKDLLSRKVTELSIGQQERVSLALALTQSANYYLLDEPFSAQDSQSIEGILQIISELRKEKGVLVISHNQDAISQYFDREISLA